MDNGGDPITSVNSARKDRTLDYRRCAALHNMLVELAWVAEGRILEKLEPRSFFQRYSDEANENRNRIDPSLRAFLESINVSKELPPFLYWSRRNRFLTLYRTNIGLGEHPLGLLYDQKLQRATLTLGLEDMEFAHPVEQHDELWHPLETQPYSEAQVESAIAAFERLAAIIEERMPVSGEQLDAASVPTRRPAFKMIAPGLEIPHDPEAFVSNQKFTVMDVDPKYGIVIPPVLIFGSVERRAMDLDSPNRYVSFNPFAKAFRDGVAQGDRSIIAGLYSESVERLSIDVAKEGFRLLLPFRFHSLGQNGGARKSDGSLLTEGSVAELFQHGFKPFGEEYHLIETGVWTIDNEGVQGGIDLFRDAHLSNDYYIRPNW
ncbi:hypothetical protein F5Y09DRAFT_351211 [Xylaria sp. FL1042]|nr:hypothetical protein F5Y09DRAFT_351211 [Xylaria sp. FL1042]